jgi:hypothetical protein
MPAAVGTAISSVQVKVDGSVVGTATYGISRPDVCAAYPGRPGCPNVGYSFSLNTSTLSAGYHTITVTATDSDGTPDTGSASVTLGLLPAALSHDIGSDSQRPFAIVIAGGPIINLAMSIFILPNLYVWFASEGDRLPEAGETFEG